MNLQDYGLFALDGIFVSSSFVDVHPPCHPFCHRIILEDVTVHLPSKIIQPAKPGAKASSHPNPSFSCSPYHRQFGVQNHLGSPLMSSTGFKPATANNNAISYCSGRMKVIAACQGCRMNVPVHQWYFP